jgi:hypothetical protein
MPPEVWGCTLFEPRYPALGPEHIVYRYMLVMPFYLKGMFLPRLTNHYCLTVPKAHPFPMI